MLEQLRKADLFHHTHGCKHHAFSNFRNNPVITLQQDVSEWMKSQWTKLLAGLL